MLYIIKGKPYIKVANYYKLVEVTKKRNEYTVTPVGGKETRIENPDKSEITQISVEKFYNEKLNKGLSGKSRMDIDGLE